MEFLLLKDRFTKYPSTANISYTQHSEALLQVKRALDICLGLKGVNLFVKPTALVGGFAGLAILFHFNDERRAIPKGQGENFERSSIKGPIIGGPFSLIDTEGRLVTERNLLGNWVLLYFGYTSSPDVGPAEVQKMANAVNILESEQKLKVLPVFVTIDPQRDNPSQLHAYLKGRTVWLTWFAEFDSRILGLTGPVAAVRQMAQEYRVFFRKVEEDGDDYLVESSHNIPAVNFFALKHSQKHRYLMNPKMEIVRCFGVEYNAAELSEEMLKELKKT
ncbi:hypothetical protein RJ640_008946 [Escallonia rubra]|uniref:Uncharacterized protein n=1 Tax=Escallonia rubra TaxID=112253 RepID=A0AA88S2H5_9ASTE|nr:hypothetical protein RJ640_008946 [Escallonia rubra]